MAKLILAVRALAVVAIFVAAGVIGCASWFPAEITRPVVNGTGATITHVYIREVGEPSWGTERNRVARTQVVMKYSQNNGSYTTTEYVRDGSGNIIYDRKDLVHGDFYPYSFSVPKAPEGQTTPLPVVDVKVVDRNGFVYGKSNIDLALVTEIRITKDDVYPVLIVENATGFDATVTTPNQGRIANGESAAVYQLEELGRTENINVGLVDENGMLYGKANISLARSERVAITPDDMFPALKVRNNTGFPIRVNEPKSLWIGDGQEAAIYQNLESRATNVTVFYNSGNFVFKKDVMLADQHAVLTLTENDRAPVVTIQNNTDKTVNLVDVRNSGPNSRWTSNNVLTLNLKDDGTVEKIDAESKLIDRRGSLTNKESFQFWLGNLDVKAGNFDVRLDNAQGDSYVKNNVQINRDVTLTFTPADKP
jgi:hypothetical protein